MWKQGYISMHSIAAKCNTRLIQCIKMSRMLTAWAVQCNDWFLMTACICMCFAIKYKKYFRVGMWKKKISLATACAKRTSFIWRSTVPLAMKWQVIPSCLDFLKCDIPFDTEILYLIFRILYQLDRRAFSRAVYLKPMTKTRWSKAFEIHSHEIMICQETGHITVEFLN
jgi:hypothetical protein